MRSRNPRGKPKRGPAPAPAAPPPRPEHEPARDPEERTLMMETSPELLEAMRDESERDTIRIPIRPPFAPPEAQDLQPEPDEPRERIHDATVLARVVVGPDGIARALDTMDELEETTRPFIPPKNLLGRSRQRKKGS